MNFPDAPLGGPEPVDFGYVESDFLMGVDSWFQTINIFFVIFAVFFVALLGFVIFVFIRNFNTSKKAGLDPFTLQTELAARAVNSSMLAPRQSREQRLAELSDLLARHVISREEYDEARMKILTEE